MCQGYEDMVFPPCWRCGGGYTAGLGNYIEHKPWCNDDEEVKRRHEAERKRREEALTDCY